MRTGASAHTMCRLKLCLPCRPLVYRLKLHGCPHSSFLPTCSDKLGYSSFDAYIQLYLFFRRSPILTQGKTLFCRLSDPKQPTSTPANPSQERCRGFLRACADRLATFHTCRFSERLSGLF